MIAHYINYIDEQPEPAMLLSPVRGVVHANTRAEPWDGDLVQMHLLETVAADCVKTGRAALHEAAGASFLLVPVVELQDQSTLVVAVGGKTLEELPVVLRDLHESSSYFSQIIHVLPQIILTARPNGAFDYASHRWYAVTGLSNHEHDVDAAIRRTLSSQSPGFADGWLEGVASREPFTLRLQLRTPAGLRVHKLEAFPWWNGTRIRKWLIAIHDVDQETRLSRDVADARLRLQVLAEVDADLIDMSDEPEHALVRALGRAQDALGGTWFLACPIGDAFIRAGARPAERKILERIEGLPGGQGTAEYRLEVGDGVRHCLVTPLGLDAQQRSRLAVIGAGNGFVAEDVHTVSEIAARITAALRGFAAYFRERTIARVLQTAMLPTALPAPLTARIDVEYRPAQNAAMVGGDWYDAFELRDGRIVFSIGDVAGHGLDSAVVMGHVRDMVRSYSLQGRSPGDVLSEVNQSIVAMGREMVTALLGVFDPLTLAMEYACAGHPPALLVRRDGEIEALELGGLIMGVDPHEQYASYRRTIDGDAIVLHTDGLVEFSHNILQGEKRLRDVLTQWAIAEFADSPSQLVDRVLGGKTADDDIAMMLIRFSQPSHLATSLPSTARDASRARQVLERMVRSSGLGKRGPDFVLAMCEAINNAVEHGSAARDFVEIDVEFDRAGARGMVRSHGAWLTPRNADERGRGLVLMRALSDSLHIDAGERGTAVHIALAVASP